MLQIFSKNRILFAGYFLILIFCILLLLFMGKKDTHLFLTGIHSVFFDGFMKLLTWLGDGIFMIITGVMLLFKRIRYGLIILCSYLASGLLVQLLKRLVFPGYKRPVAWFHDMGIEIYRIGGVEYYSAFSFPSGHTTTAFTLFFLLAFFVKSNLLKALFLLMAVITGFSRIYLSQHFLGDTVAGSVLGIFIAVMVYSLFQNCKTVWLDNNIISLIWKKNA